MPKNGTYSAIAIAPAKTEEHGNDSAPHLPPRERLQRSIFARPCDVPYPCMAIAQKYIKLTQGGTSAACGACGIRAAPFLFLS
jgi:hypothetical protein